MLYVMESPSPTLPLPGGLVVKNGSNSLAGSRKRSPPPCSRNEILTIPSLHDLTLAIRSPPLGMAAHAFSIRLMNTC